MTRVFDEHSGISPVVTPAGLRVFGGVRSATGGWRPAMVDPSTGQCVWQGTGEFMASFGVWTPRFAIRGNFVFVFNENSLACLDGNSGHELWRVRTNTDLGRDSNRWRSDGATDYLAIDVLETPQGARAVVKTDDDGLHVFDLHSGRLIWNEMPDNGDYTIVPGVGVLVFMEDAPAQLRDANGDVKWSRELHSALLSGAHLFAKVKNSEGDGALACLDAATGAEKWCVDEDSLESVDEGVAVDDHATLVVTGPFSQRLWSVSASSGPRKGGFFARLFGRTHGDAMPVKRATIDTTTRVGNRVFVTFNSPLGKHLVVLDAASGQPVAAPHPLPGDWAHVRGHGTTAVVRCDLGDNKVQLMAFGPDGKLRWQRDLDDASEHFCHHGDVVVEMCRQVAVLDGNDGSTRFAYVN